MNTDLTLSDLRHVGVGDGDSTADLAGTLLMLDAAMPAIAIPSIDLLVGRTGIERAAVVAALDWARHAGYWTRWTTEARGVAL